MLPQDVQRLWRGAHIEGKLVRVGLVIDTVLGAEEVGCCGEVKGVGEFVGGEGGG